MADEQRAIALDRERRNFLNWFLGTTAGAFIVSVLYPLSRYLIPPRVAESTARTVPNVFTSPWTSSKLIARDLTQNVRAHKEQIGR